MKYSHHPDGNVHFSQDGKVYTQIRKKSVELHRIQGHVFTVQIKGLMDFEQYDYIKESGIDKRKKEFIIATFPKGEPESIKIVGRLYTKEEVKRTSGITSISPEMRAMDPSGDQYSILVVSAPKSNPSDDLLLLLEIYGIPNTASENESVFTFFGGFDNSQLLNDLENETSFLACIYSNSNNEELISQIGTIDILQG